MLREEGGDLTIWQPHTSTRQGMPLPLHDITLDRTAPSATFLVGKENLSDTEKVPAHELHKCTRRPYTAKVRRKVPAPSPPNKMRSLATRAGEQIEGLSSHSIRRRMEGQQLYPMGRRRGKNQQQRTEMTLPSQRITSWQATSQKRGSANKSPPNFLR
uniref:Uncharacterized protein n=1 Tax=Sphaerodactylus townsendi TaxID=933632 RepID=A0ACB8F2C4_9SAUR